MSASNQQIVDLAKRGFEPAQIASALGMSIEGVTAVLTIDSGAVKELANAGLEDKFKPMVNGALGSIEYLSQFAENEGVRLKAAAYITDQQLGLKKPKQVMVQNFNVHMFMARVEQAREKARELHAQVTDVTTSELSAT